MNHWAKTTLGIGAVLWSGCFSFQKLDPRETDPDSGSQPDMNQQLDTSQQPDTAGADIGGAVDTGPSGDMEFVRQVPDEPSYCGRAQRPSLFPAIDIVPEGSDPLQVGVSLTYYQSPAGEHQLALAHKTIDISSPLFRLDLLEVSPDSGWSVRDAGTPAYPIFPAATSTDVAVGRNGVNSGFQVALAGTPSDCGVTPNSLWVTTDQTVLPIDGACPATIWDVGFGGGLGAFGDAAPITQRLTYFELPDGGGAMLTTLHAPYSEDGYRAVPFDAAGGSGWLQTTHGDLVLAGAADGEVFVWDTAIRTSYEPDPISLQRRGEGVLNGIAALDDDRYVVAWADGDAVNVDIYRHDWMLAAFDRQYRADRFTGLNPRAVKVAAFPGGFAVFIEDAGARWFVNTYEENGSFGPTGCAFEYSGFDITTRDVQLLAYRDGDALQVLAAVQFNFADQTPHINVEGPRWPDYFFRTP